MHEASARLVPVTEADKQKRYYKYFLEEMAPVDPGVYAAAAAARLTPDQVLTLDQVNLLFEPGYLPAERGYCALPDGSAYMANLLFMPNVTPEMFDWWFAWHGLDSLRYKIWDREDHMYCQTRNPERARDPALSYREKYWYTTHDITEAFGPEPKDVVVPFIPPQDMGFSPQKLEKFDGTIVAMAGEDCRTVSCHFVRPAEGGVELRSRFWFGWCLSGGKPRRFDGERLPEQLPRALLLHNIKEFTNLARLLPRIFPEEKGNF